MDKLNEGYTIPIQRQPSPDGQLNSSSHVSRRRFLSSIATATLFGGIACRPRSELAITAQRFRDADREVIGPLPDIDTVRSVISRDYKNVRDLNVKPIGTAICSSCFSEGFNKANKGEIFKVHYSLCLRPSFQHNNTTIPEILAFSVQYNDQSQWPEYLQGVQVSFFCAGMKIASGVTGRSGNVEIEINPEDAHGPFSVQIDSVDEMRWSDAYGN